MYQHVLNKTGTPNKIEQRTNKGRASEDTHNDYVNYDAAWNQIYAWCVAASSGVLVLIA